ncbi:hypothetical protein DL93DRAFT_1600159 [Clavulina sp. PMI_390]|nr:hypothetical protein DL93DRAFT_1600159 [Clavulina sp. PMI_390]
MSMDMIPVPRPRKYLDPFNGAQTPERTIDTTRYILSVSQVCRKWKKSVWNTSALWAFVSLNWKVAQRDFWMQRLPPRRGIDVSGYNIDLYTPKPSGEIGAFLRLNAQRIKSLTLVSCNLSLLRDFTLALALPTSSPSIIESIEIKNDEHDVMLFGPWGDRRVYYPGAEQQTLLNDVRVPDQHLWPAQTTSVEIAARLPCLRSFTMWPRSVRLNSMLHNVTCLDLALPLYSTWSQWVTVLSEPEQLKSLVISSQDTVSDEEEDIEPLVLQHLRTLDIGTASHVGFVGVFLGRVQAPALHFLKFLLPRSTPQSAQSTALIQVMSTFVRVSSSYHTV